MGEVVEEVSEPRQGGPSSRFPRHRLQFTSVTYFSSTHGSPRLPFCRSHPRSDTYLASLRLPQLPTPSTPLADASGLGESVADPPSMSIPRSPRSDPEEAAGARNGDKGGKAPASSIHSDLLLSDEDTVPLSAADELTLVQLQEQLGSCVGGSECTAIDPPGNQQNFVHRSESAAVENGSMDDSLHLKHLVACPIMGAGAVAESVGAREDGSTDGDEDEPMEEGEIMVEPTGEDASFPGNDTSTMGSEMGCSLISLPGSSTDKVGKLCSWAGEATRGDLDSLKEGYAHKKPLASSMNSGSVGGTRKSVVKVREPAVPGVPREGCLLDYGDLDFLSQEPVSDMLLSSPVKRAPNGKGKSKLKAPESLTAGSPAGIVAKPSDPSEDKKGSGVSKKKPIISEERKAKKKLAKKRKRAETNKKLGIKRLRITPVSMPKKVVYCSFYLKGRCQQGSSCKFSHDTIPLTKSQPCTHFARNSCLKGDDCPFDHELGKYPCHNFVSKGFCSRGEACKFSHKVTVENSIDATGKHDSPLTVETFSSNGHFKTDVPSRPVISELAMRAVEPPKQNNKSKLPEKSLQKIPKGISFLSFDDDSTGDANKPRNAPPSALGHATAMSKSQNNMQQSIPQRSFTTPARSLVHPSSSIKLKGTIPITSDSAGRCSQDMFAAENTQSSVKTVVETANICSSMPPSTSMAGGASKSTVETARLLDEFLFHENT